MIKTKTTTATMLVLISALGFCGCAVVGPQSIAAGRGVYAEVINRTEDEQILNVIVRQRYDETFGMMSVASVTANLRFSAQAGTNIGIGDSVRELLDLLGIEVKPDGSTIILPVREAVGGSVSAIYVQTR